VTASRSPAQVLAAARRETSLRKRQAVFDTPAAIAAEGEPITFTKLARRSAVSTWLVYADGVREHVHAAIDRQDHQVTAALGDGRTASSAGLKAELAMSRAEVAELRGERDRLREALRVNLGRQLDQAGNRTLIERITELTEQARRLERCEAEARARNTELAERVRELEGELAGARTSLRTVLRQTNRQAPVAEPDALPAMIVTADHAPGCRDVTALPTRTGLAGGEPHDDEH
jgi:hypothetical protein